MKNALSPIAALILLTLFPAPAQAHDCEWDDARCVAQCVPHSVATGDTCGIDPMDPPTRAPCAADEVGTVIYFDGRSARVCAPVPKVDTASCPPGWMGIVILVEGRPLTACVNP